MFFSFSSFSIPPSLDYFFTGTLPFASLTQFTPTTSCVNFVICFATLYTFFVFDVLSNSLTSPRLVFLCAKATLLSFRLVLCMYSDHLLFWFYAVTYSIFFSELLLLPIHSTTVFHYARWFFCPLMHLFCCILARLFHRIPFIVYNRRRKYLILLSATNRANSCLILGCLSIHAFSVVVCISFFILVELLMMTSPTSNRCCDALFSPAITFTFLTISQSVTRISSAASNLLYSVFYQTHRWPIYSFAS